jgi:glucose/arabinose dehydrogenase
MTVFSAALTRFYFFGMVYAFPVLTFAQDLKPVTSNPGKVTPNTQNTPASAVKPLRALRPDIQIAHLMLIEPKAVRLLYQATTGTLWYVTFDGDVYQIKNNKSATPTTQKIVTAQDHAITRLQGAVFLNNSLFLCGNTSANNGKGTTGRLVRLDMPTSGKPTLTEVFNTVEYGTNKTVFDHGWNALEISPDGKHIFVNSGARTDHGEVQDNDGFYPNARNGALTGNLFRFPVTAKDLLLPDDLAQLKAKGYLYAEGIRNAFDLAFDGEGHLFGVSNSADYDMPEDMFWIREGHHYGFPWVMGGIENPQQYPDWQPSPETDPFINKFAHAWQVRYFHNDPDFPKRPAGVKFSPGVQNLGPDANEYRTNAGKIVDGDQTGITISTFTPHASPLGLFFDKKKVLANDFKGDGFVIRYTLGARSSLMKTFTAEGADLLHLDLAYNQAADNYYVKTTRLVDGLKEATDAVLVGNEVYVIEYSGRNKGNLWKITLPKDATAKITEFVK